MQWDGVLNGKDFGIIGNVYDGGCASSGVWAPVFPYFQFRCDTSRFFRIFLRTQKLQLYLDVESFGRRVVTISMRSPRLVNIPSNARLSRTILGSLAA
jgi:hypothetical protein